MGSLDGASIVAAAPPPPGVTSNFESPDWIGYRIIIVAVVFPVIALFFLVPRLYSATYILRKWHPDEYLICLGFVTATANSVVCIVEATAGMGNHIWDVPSEKFKDLMKLLLIGGAMTNYLTTLFVKLSILSFYLRFSVDSSFKLAVYFVMFIVVGYLLPNIFLFLFTCRPIAFFWDPTIPEGTCVNVQALFDSANILNMVTDFMILLLPFWMLRPLRIPLRQKLGIALLLMTGGFVCAISAMRMATARASAAETDITWHYVDNLSWILVEEYVGIVCACMPCLKSFFKRFFPTLFVFDPAFEQRLSSILPVVSQPATPASDDSLGGRQAWSKARQELKDEERRVQVNKIRSRECEASPDWEKDPGRLRV